jgi:predicted nucleotidyltransferase component of viral defense system
LYGLDRFSTDLDFDLLDTTKNVDEKLIKILKKYGQVKK